MLQSPGMADKPPSQNNGTDGTDVCCAPRQIISISSPPRMPRAFGFSVHGCARMTRHASILPFGCVYVLFRTAFLICLFVLCSLHSRCLSPMPFNLLSLETEPCLQAPQNQFAEVWGGSAGVRDLLTPPPSLTPDPSPWRDTHSSMSADTQLDIANANHEVRHLNAFACRCTWARDCKTFANLTRFSSTTCTSNAMQVLKKIQTRLRMRAASVRPVRCCGLMPM